MAMQSLTVDLDGPYHYADHGGDGPPMVLLHGIGGSHLNWMSVAPTLAQSFHVYALDMIGFGFTPNGRRDSKLPTQARYVDRFIGEVAGAPAVVMGHSMGGLVAMLLAAQYPAMVERLVAVDPAACVIRSQAAGVPTWLMLALAVFPDIGGRLAGQIARRRDTEELVRETLGRAYGAGTPIDPDFLAAQVDLERRRGLLPVPYRGYVEGWASMRNVHAERDTFVTDVVERVKAPMLLVRGTVDPLIPQRWFERLTDVRPDWDNARLEGVGHDPHMEAPEAFLEAVVGWLRGSGGWRRRPLLAEQAVEEKVPSTLRHRRHRSEAPFPLEAEALEESVAGLVVDVAVGLDPSQEPAANGSIEDQADAASTDALALRPRRHVEAEGGGPVDPVDVEERNPTGPGAVGLDDPGDSIAPLGIE